MRGNLSHENRALFSIYGGSLFKAKIAAAASENEAIYCIRYAVVNRRLHLVWQTKSIVIKLNVCRLGLRTDAFALHLLHTMRFVFIDD